MKRLLLICGLALMLAPVALAAKPASVSSSIQIVEAGPYTVGQQVTFSYTDASNQRGNRFVSLQCSQTVNGATYVISQAQYVTSSPSPVFALPGLLSGVSLETCRASLMAESGGGSKTIAVSASFTVS